MVNVNVFSTFISRGVHIKDRQQEINKARFCVVAL